MRRTLGLVFMLVVYAAHADSGTLRVGSQVLVVGDSATRVVELLGKPSYKSHGRATSRTTRRGRAARVETAGEHWQYRVGNRLVTVVVTNGKISAIRD